MGEPRIGARLLALAAGIGAVFILLVSSERSSVTMRGITDLSDALLIYDSGDTSITESGFRKVVGFYGLTIAELDVSQSKLLDSSLRDESGVYYPTVYITAATAESELGDDELNALKNAVQAGGVNLFVGELGGTESRALQYLTDGEILGGSPVLDSSRDYLISTALPEITRELTGITVVHNSKPLQSRLDVLDLAPYTTALFTATQDNGQTYPVFACHQHGHGRIMVSTISPDVALRDAPLFESYNATRLADGTYKSARFAQVVPLMMFVRNTAGEEAWHRDRDYANLTIDDPGLAESYLDYRALLADASTHGYHVTIAMPAALYRRREPDVVKLVRSHPEQLSLTIHGNNHDGYEFYKDSVTAEDTYPSRSLEEQEADIVEGLTRMEALRAETGIPYSAVMVFPYNISSTSTLVLLKQYNFQATVNSMDVPLGETRSNLNAAHLYPAELAYGEFAVLLRHHTESAPYALSLFVDKPALFYEHPDFIQTNSVSVLSRLAKQIEELHGDVEWQSLDYIMKHLYLQKTNDDGSVDIMLFGNRLSLKNEGSANQLYHLKRPETGNVAIRRVTVDGLPADYRIENGSLQNDVNLPPGASRELSIVYAPADCDFALKPQDVQYDAATRTLVANVRNTGTYAGPVTVGVFRGSPESGGNLLALLTAHRIEPGERVALEATLKLDTQAAITVAIDPYDVIVETDESNNRVVLDLAGRRSR